MRRGFRTRSAPVLTLLLLLWLVTWPAISFAEAANPAVAVHISGVPLKLSSPPLTVDGRLLVPVRGLVEAMGGQVHWNPTGVVTAILRSRTVVLRLGQTTAQVNGSERRLDVPAQVIGGRTYIPLRFVGEGLGAAVHYDGKGVFVEPPRPDELVVVDGPLNVRLFPTTQAPILTSVPLGTRLVVDEAGGEWSRVTLPRGRSGWVASKFTARAAEYPSIEPLRPALAGATAWLEVHGECLGPVPTVDDRVYLPVRSTVLHLGGQVAGAADGGITLSHGSTRVRVREGVRSAVVNQYGVPMEAPPVELAGRLFAPARTLADWFGWGLHWDQARRTASISLPGLPQPQGRACNPAEPAASYLVMDAATGLVLAESQADQSRLIASTTKLMTALLAVEQGNLDAMVTVSPRAANSSRDGTLMGLKAGERLSLRDLLHGLILRSGNDAAVAIAEHLAGSEEGFARLMTRRAAELGAAQTSFPNASGLDDWGARPVSTARDLALIAQHALRDVDLRALVSATEYVAAGPTGPRKLTNRNDFVLTYAGATGVKNGWTPAAGHTLVASAYRDGRELIVVILGAEERTALYRMARELMDQGFRLASQSWVLAEARDRS